MVVLIIVIVVVVSRPRPVGRLQQPRQEAQPDPGGVVGDRCRAQAPPRSDPQPGLDGAGLRRPRAGDLRGSDPGSGQRGHRRRDRRSRQIAPAENALSGALRSLFAVAENYPQLRAVESFLQLQETLTATEDKVEYARRYYNTSARDYNIALQSFPRNVIAGPFGFKAVAFFGADEEDRAVPQVSFSSSEPGAAGPAPVPAAGPEGPPPAGGTQGPPPAG